MTKVIANGEEYPIRSFTECIFLMYYVVDNYKMVFKKFDNCKELTEEEINRLQSALLTAEQVIRKGMKRSK